MVEGVGVQWFDLDLTFDLAAVTLSSYLGFKFLSGL